MNVNDYIPVSLSETSMKHPEASSCKGSGAQPGPLSDGLWALPRPPAGSVAHEDKRGPGNVRGELKAHSALSPPLTTQERTMLLSSQLQALPGAPHPCCSPAAPRTLLG